MDVREKLVELLWEASSLVNNELPTVEQMAESLIANGVTVQEYGEWEYIGKNIHGQKLTRCKQCKGNSIEGGLFCRNCGAIMVQGWVSRE